MLGACERQEQIRVEERALSLPSDLFQRGINRRSRPCGSRQKHAARELRTVETPQHQTQIRRERRADLLLDRRQVSGLRRRLKDDAMLAVLLFDPTDELTDATMHAVGAYPESALGYAAEV